MYCMEFLEKNMDWLMKQLSSYKDHYFLFDCPGQVCHDHFICGLQTGLYLSSLR
jgi:hypothetical protein